VHAKDLVCGISSAVRDYEMHLVLAHQYGFFRFVAGATPARFFQSNEEVLGMLAWFRPVKAGRTGEHDMREVKLTIHSDRVACVEVGSESSGHSEAASTAEQSGSASGAVLTKLLNSVMFEADG